MKDISHCYEHKYWFVSFNELHEQLRVEMGEYLVYHGPGSFEGMITEKYPAETDEMERDEYT